MTIFIIVTTLLFATISITPMLAASAEFDGLVRLPE
jgi:hypothetical protein